MSVITFFTSLIISIVVAVFAPILREGLLALWESFKDWRDENDGRIEVVVIRYDDH